MANFQYIRSEADNVFISIVRPFGEATIRPRPIAPLKNPTPKPEGPNLFTWGNAGNSIFQVRANLKAETPKPENEEVTRKYDVVRVYNKDDREQYVDTEVMTEVALRNKIDKSRFIIRYGETKADENSEIIKKGQTRTSAAGND